MALNPKNLSPKYGSEIARFGRWVVTSKGIVTKIDYLETEDYFIDNETLNKLSSTRKLFDELFKESWMDAIDYHELITSWFYKLSLTKINPDPDEPCLAETLSEIQVMLEKKFTDSLSQ
jgi:hypothetical protein